MIDTKAWTQHAIEDTKDWTEKAAKDTKDWTEKAIRDTSDWTEQAAKDGRHILDERKRRTGIWLDDYIHKYLCQYD